jgi:hypothetical protein
MNIPWRKTGIGADHAVRRDDVLARARRNDRIYLGIAVTALLSFGYAVFRLI